MQKMKPYLYYTAILSIVSFLESCSCAIYGNQFQAIDSSLSINSQQISELAREMKFRKKSEAQFKRDDVYLTYFEDRGVIYIGGSFCSLPHELLFSSPSKIEGQVASTENEVKEWFRSRGISLKVAPPALD